METCGHLPVCVWLGCGSFPGSARTWAHQDDEAGPQGSQLLSISWPHMHHGISIFYSLIVRIQGMTFGAASSTQSAGYSVDEKRVLIQNLL